MARVSPRNLPKKSKDPITRKHGDQTPAVSANGGNNSKHTDARKEAREMQKRRTEKRRQQPEMARKLIIFFKALDTDADTLKRLKSLIDSYVTNNMQREEFWRTMESLNITPSLLIDNGIDLDKYVSELFSGGSTNQDVDAMDWDETTTAVNDEETPSSTNVGNDRSNVGDEAPGLLKQESNDTTQGKTKDANTEVEGMDKESGDDSSPSSQTGYTSEGAQSNNEYGAVITTSRRKIRRTPEQIRAEVSLKGINKEICYMKSDIAIKVVGRTCIKQKNGRVLESAVLELISKVPDLKGDRAKDYKPKDFAYEKHPLRTYRLVANPWKDAAKTERLWPIHNPNQLKNFTLERGVKLKTADEYIQALKEAGETVFGEIPILAVAPRSTCLLGAKPLDEAWPAMDENKVTWRETLIKVPLVPDLEEGEKMPKMRYWETKWIWKSNLDGTLEGIKAAAYIKLALQEKRFRKGLSAWRKYQGHAEFDDRHCPKAYARSIDRGDIVQVLEAAEKAGVERPDARDCQTEERDLAPPLQYVPEGSPGPDEPIESIEAAYSAARPHIQDLIDSNPKIRKTLEKELEKTKDPTERAVLEKALRSWRPNQEPTPPPDAREFVGHAQQPGLGRGVPGSANNNTLMSGIPNVTKRITIQDANSHMGLTPSPEPRA